MSIKEIRLLSGLTQRAFAEQYKIPLQTIKQWESDINSKSYRKPPEYIEYLLQTLVIKSKTNSLVANENYLIRAALDSRYDMALWCRYLRKELNNGEVITDEIILKEAISSPLLTMFQKISLNRLLEKDSETYNYVMRLNEPAHATMMEQIRRKHAK